MTIPAEYQNGAKTIKPGELYVSDEPLLLKTVLGSCVAVCLFDKKHKRGGMNHFVNRMSAKGEQSLRYGDFAMKELIEGFLERGLLIGDLTASVFEGATGFYTTPEGSPRDLNIAEARQALKKYGIPIIKEDTGCCHGRNITFQSESGAITAVIQDSCLKKCGKKSCELSVGG